MRKCVVFLLISMVSLNLYAQRKPKIKGNRNVIEVKESLGPFSTIELVDDLDIVLEKSSQEGYALTLDDNLVDVLKFDVENGVLRISSFYTITSKKKLEITVYYHDLIALVMENGKISMTDVISTARLKVNTSGTSRLELNATADVMDITMEEISSGDFNLASDSLNIILKDRIDVKLYTTGDTNTLYMYENATAKLEGSIDFLSVKLYGNSTLNASALESGDVTLVVEDSPDAAVRALNGFQLSSKGAARTTLYGNPKITILDFLDTSLLEKEPD